MPVTECPYQLGPQTVKMSEIKPNPVSLRQVNRKSDQYLGLVNSIKEKGFISSISARAAQMKDPDNGEPTGEWFLELVDGLHRYTAAMDAGLQEISCVVVDFNEDEVLEAQMMANFHKVDTQPAAYSQQLRRILDRNPEMTEASLAKRLGVSTQVIENRLSLNKLADDNLKALVNEGKIKLANAYALAKLPPEEQANFLEDAMTLVNEEFLPKVTARVKEIKEANRKGEDAKPQEFVPTPHLRKLNAIKEEIGIPESSPKSHSVEATLLDNCNTLSEAFRMGVLWSISMDPVTVAADKAKDEARRKEKKEAQLRRDAERARTKERNAERKQREASLEADIAEGFQQGTITQEQAKEMRDKLQADFAAEEAASKTEQTESAE